MARAIVKTIKSDPNPVGSTIHSMLTEVQFQAEFDTTWVLMDGRSINGSDYDTLVFNDLGGNIPDARGRFLRSKAHTSGNNPDGDLNLGQYQADEFFSHTHVQHRYLTATGGILAYTANNDDGTEYTAPTGSAGGNETRSKNITVNIFIKINN